MYQRLEKPGHKWGVFGVVSLIGNIAIMAFYTVVTGWILYYFVKFLTGQHADFGFAQMIADPGLNVTYLLVVLIAAFVLLSFNLQGGLERVTKYMMSALLVLMLVLAVHSLTFAGAAEGLRFYLVPDFSAIDGGVIVAAMNQAFFSLSVGMGGMAIFGSYIGKEHSLLGESVRVVVLDTFVAITAGLIIFPACFTFGVDQTARPQSDLHHPAQYFCQHGAGAAVGQPVLPVHGLCGAFHRAGRLREHHLLRHGADRWNRQKSSLVNFFLIIALSLPCVLGYNVWAWDGFAIFGGAVLDVEDFLVSNLFLPLGSLVYLLFCVSRYGWGWDNYKKEVNTGEGLKIQDWMRGYLTYGLPVIVLFIFAFGIYDKFFA